MIRYAFLFLTLLGVNAHAVMLPDGRAPSCQPPDQLSQRLIIKLRDNPLLATASAERQEEQVILEATGLRTNMLRRMDSDAAILDLPQAVTPEQAEAYVAQIEAYAVGRIGAHAERMSQESIIEYVELDTWNCAERTPNDTYYNGSQGHLKAPADGGAGAANLPQAWDITTGSDDIVVSVIDTGALDHGDLQSRYVGGSAAASGRDFISLYSGYSFMPVDGDGRDDDPTDPGDWTDGTYCRAGNSSWHGSHVAGTIGAATDNGLHVAGIDWQAQLLTARVLGRCGGFGSDIADGMRWSAGLTVDGLTNANPARVLNLSLGGYGACSTTYQNAINAVVDEGAVVVVAAGNSNDDVVNYRPASCDNVITVAALDSSTGGRASFSNYGEEVGIAAPGVRIASTINSGGRTAVAGGDITALYNGTSMATPHVSGVVALMLAANQAAGGDLMADARKAETSSRITAKLQASARAFPTGTGRDCATTTCGAGMLDAHQAVVAVSTAPTVNAGDNQSVAGGATVALSAAISDDAYNTATTWQWTQTSGATVTLNNATGRNASFTAPSANETLSFTVTATDDTGLTGTDSVDVQVSVTGDDITPNAFRFTDQTDVALNTVITSNTITVSGINAATAILITDGQYSINGAAFTNAVGTVDNNDTVRVQHTSSDTYSTQVDTTLTIGGVSDVFSSTTSAADTTPNAFNFTDRTGVTLSTAITSNAITVSGINAAAAISVTGGSYSVNGAAFTNVVGTVNNNDTVRVQHTSSDTYSTRVDTTLTIGGVSDVFSSTTSAADTTPNAFSFTDRTDVILNTVITSDMTTVSGINAAAAISVTGGSYSVNGAAFTNAVGTVNNNDTVRVRHTSSSDHSTQVDTTLTIGGVSDTFSSTTRAATSSSCESAISLGQNVSGSWESESGCVSTHRSGHYAKYFTFTLPDSQEVLIDLQSVTDPYLFLLEGAGQNGSVIEFDDDGGDGLNSRIIRTLPAGTYTVETTTWSSVNLTGNFTLLVAIVDVVPDAFSFTDQTNVASGTTITSNAVTVTGVNTATAISITGGQYSVNGANFTSTAGTVNNGDSVRAQHTSSSSHSTQVDTTLTIGGVSDTFSSTTSAECENPISLNQDVSGHWESGCASTHRSGRYAQYFTFTLTGSQEVTIDLQSATDTYLFLLEGAERDGSVIESDDDGGNGLNSRIVRTLSAGTYTVEATTYSSGATGSFTVSVAAADSAQCGVEISLNQDVFGNWESDCASTHRSGRYAKYFTFTLADAQEVTIDLQSTTDAYLFLLDGSGQDGSVLASDDDGGDGRNSRIVRTLSAGTYTVEATTYSSGRTGTFNVSITTADQLPAGQCETAINLNQGMSDDWESGCASTNRSGSYAKYFTFTLADTQEVTIDLQSATDTYLFLLDGAGQNGSELASDDDGGNGRNSRIVRTLSAGTYTVEATTYSSGTTGSFTVSVAAAAPLQCMASIDLNQTLSDSWESNCASTHRSGRYAKYFTFTLPGSQEVAIDLQSATDTYLFLLDGAGQNGSELASDDDGGNGLNSRIVRTLSAGTYTVEATTYSSGATGNFTVSVAD